MFAEKIYDFYKSSQFRVELHGSYQTALHRYVVKWTICCTFTPKQSRKLRQDAPSNPCAKLDPNQIQIWVIGAYMGQTVLLDHFFVMQFTSFYVEELNVVFIVYAHLCLLE